MYKDPQIIEDVQNFEDVRNININRAGVKSVRHPIAIQNKHGQLQHTVGIFDMYVNLPHNVKGTHMSRFIDIINADNIILAPDKNNLFINTLAEKLESKNAYINIAFPYFLKKVAPVSKVESVMDYEINFKIEKVQEKIISHITAQVPVTSLCPCSKTISKYGAHNQRSHINIHAQIENEIWIDDLIAIAEQESSCELYGILKRPDEKFVTEKAYENPKFVEDTVRDIAKRLKQDLGIKTFNVEAENFESIHNHSAYAMIESL